MKRSFKKIFSLFAFLGVAASYPVAAHHSTTMFDHAKVVSIAGTVKEVHWTNPHVAIFVYGSLAAGGEPTLWLMEMTIPRRAPDRSEEHTSELQSRLHLVCRLLLEKKK